MSKEKSAPGKLVAEVHIPITTQEQSYRALVQVPDLDSTTVEALLMAIAKGSELHWVKTAVTYSRFPLGAPSRQVALTRLAESSFEAMRQVLEQKDAKLYRNKIASRFAATYDGSMVALKLDADWTQAQTIRFISMVMPHIGEKDAISLLASSCVRNLPVEYRSPIVLRVRSWPHFPIGYFFVSGSRYPDPKPPWSTEERACLIAVIAKSEQESHTVLFPYSFQKLNSLKYSEDPDKERVNKKEKQLLAEKAGLYILSRLRMQANTEHYKGEAAELLAAFEKNLSQELKEQLKKYL